MYAPKLCVHQKNRRTNSASAYYLGSAESPTADFFQVWLKSSRSGDVASRSCSPQVTWRLRSPSLYGRRHDLSKYLRLVQISAGAYIFTIFWGNVTNLSRLISVLSLHRNFVHDHKSCPNSAATLLSPYIEAVLAFGRGRWKLSQSSNGECVGGGGGGRCSWPPLSCL